MLCPSFDVAFLYSLYCSHENNPNLSLFLSLMFMIGWAKVMNRTLDLYLSLGTRGGPKAQLEFLWLLIDGAPLVFVCFWVRFGSKFIFRLVWFFIRICGFSLMCGAEWDTPQLVRTEMVVTVVVVEIVLGCCCGLIGYCYIFVCIICYLSWWRWYRVRSTFERPPSISNQIPNAFPFFSCYFSNWVGRDLF